MNANPDLPGPLSKDSRPRHKHPTKQYKKECKDDRPCAVCGHMMSGPDHHLVAKAHFTVPGIAKTYYDYLELYDGSRVYKDACANRVSLCLRCHERWHVAFGQVCSIAERHKKLRVNGVQEWGQFVNKKRHRRRSHNATMEATVPELFALEWYDAAFEKEQKRGK